MLGCSTGRNLCSSGNAGPPEGHGGSVCGTLRPYYMHRIFPFCIYITSQTCPPSSAKSQIRGKTSRPALRGIYIHTYKLSRLNKKETLKNSSCIKEMMTARFFTKRKGEERQHGICAVRCWKETGAKETKHHSLPLLCTCSPPQGLIESMKKKNPGLELTHDISAIPKPMRAFCSKNNTRKVHRCQSL